MSKVTTGECISPELSNEMQNLRGGKEIVFYQKESCVKGGKTTNITHTKGRLHKNFVQPSLRLKCLDSLTVSLLVEYM